MVKHFAVQTFHLPENRVCDTLTEARTHLLILGFVHSHSAFQFAVYGMRVYHVYRLKDFPKHEIADDFDMFARKAMGLSENSVPLDPLVNHRGSH